MVDWDKIQTSVLAVDVGDELADLPLEFRGISQRGGRHLDHDCLPDPFWVIFQEFLKCAKLC